MSTINYCLPLITLVFLALCWYLLLISTFNKVQKAFVLEKLDLHFCLHSLYSSPSAKFGLSPSSISIKSRNFFRLHFSQETLSQFDNTSLYCSINSMSLQCLARDLFQTCGNCECLSAHLSWLMILQRIWTTTSDEIGGSWCSWGFWRNPTRFKSMCSIEV